MAKCTIISFMMEKKFIYVIAYWVCEIAFRIAKYLKWDNFQLVLNDSDNEYLYIIFLNISDLLSYLVLIYEKLRFRCKKSIENENEINSNQENEVKNEYDNKINKDPIQKILWLAFIFIFDLSARFVKFIYHSIFDVDNEDLSEKFEKDFLILLDILMRFILFVIFFFVKEDFGKHKIFSISTIFFILFILVIFDGINIFFSKKYDIMNCLYYILFSLPRSIFFPLVDTLSKKLMIEKYILPLPFIRRRGVIEFIYLLIVTPILYFTSYLHISFDVFSNTNFRIIAPLYIIACYFKAFLLTNVIYEYSSEAVAFLIISEPLSGSIFRIIEYFKNSESDIRTMIFSIVEAVLIIFIGFATMVYEEIIIINKCELEKDVKKKIMERANTDTEDLTANINDISNDASAIN